MNNTEDAGVEGADGGRSSGSGLRWSPRGGAFRPYGVGTEASAEIRRRPAAAESYQFSRGRVQVIARKTMVIKLTRDLVEIYQVCNPNFTYLEGLHPKRYLTSPHVGVLNDGYDNSTSDLILSVGLVLFGKHHRYVVKETLGRGTFAQVAKCWLPETNEYVAVKIIKNQPAYHRQAVVEISIVEALNQTYDPQDEHHIVRMLDVFPYQRHLCITFEMLGPNLYEVLKINNHKGLTLNIIRDFSQQILRALVVMKDAGIIHCDLKPENILLCGSKEQPTAIKVIDFGSACMEGQTIYSYIQSRHYRSPEVLLGYPYNTAIDMWSLGCIVAELFLGLPLFPGASEFDLLKRMVEIIGGQPPDNILKEAKNTSTYFKHVTTIPDLEVNRPHPGCYSTYHLLTKEEYEARGMTPPDVGKNYFGKLVTLEEIIKGYPYRRNMSREEIATENAMRLVLVDFLKGLVEFDPVKRWSPLQASRHPFVTGEPFTCPYKPMVETPHIPVIHTVAMGHNPGGGHCLADGFSPQVSNFSQGGRHIGPRVKLAANHGGSYCSFGSHGSYIENAFPGSSYGSFGDPNNVGTYLSPVGSSPQYLQAHIRGSVFCSCPGPRPQMNCASGFGVSPSGNFYPMSFGVMPPQSQFTPNSQIQVSTSLGKYGSTSPARGTIHGSPFEKAVAIGQNNRRSSWGYRGSSSLLSQENMYQYWQGHHPDGLNTNNPTGNSHAHVDFPCHSLPASMQSNWRQQRYINGFSSRSTLATHSDVPSLHPFRSSIVSSPSYDVLLDKHESSSTSPDPADWDPNDSDDLLLQEDDSDIQNLASEFANNMCFGRSAVGLPTCLSKYSGGHIDRHPSLSSFGCHERMNKAIQTHANMDGNHAAHEMYAGPSRLSRFGQQPLPNFQHLQPSSLYSQQSEQMNLLTRANYSLSDRYFSVDSGLGGGPSWGRRVEHTFGAFLPSTHVREDFRSIA